MRGAAERSIGECEAVEDKKHDPKSHSSLLAVEDLEFLQSDEMRPLRLALEFSKVVDLALKMRGICIFGSRVGFGRRPFCSSPGSRAEPFFLR